MRESAMSFWITCSKYDMLKMFSSILRFSRMGAGLNGEQKRLEMASRSFSSIYKSQSICTDGSDSFLSTILYWVYLLQLFLTFKS